MTEPTTRTSKLTITYLTVFADRVDTNRLIRCPYWSVLREYSAESRR